MPSLNDAKRRASEIRARVNLALEESKIGIQCGTLVTKDVATRVLKELIASLPKIDTSNYTDQQFDELDREIYLPLPPRTPLEDFSADIAELEAEAKIAAPDARAVLLTTASSVKKSRLKLRKRWEGAVSWEDLTTYARMTVAFVGEKIGRDISHLLDEWEPDLTPSDKDLRTLKCRE